MEDGDGASEIGGRPLMESGEVVAARLGVRRLPRVHACAASKGHWDGFGRYYGGLDKY
jgi:hypothetical protein